MQKLEIIIGGITSTIIGNDLSITLSEKSSYFAVGLFRVDPQRLDFKYYAADYPSFDVKDEKKIIYYEDENDTSPAFTGWTRTEYPKGNNDVKAITAYDALDKLINYGDINIGHQTAHNYGSETLSLSGWIQRIAQNIDNDDINFGADISSVNTGTNGIILLAKWATESSQNTVWNPYTVNLYNLFYFLEYGRNLLQVSVYFKYNIVDNELFFIGIVKTVWSETLITTDPFLLKWTMQIYKVVNVADLSLEHYRIFEEFYDESYIWNEFVNNNGEYGDYHNDWLDTYNLEDAVFNSKLYWLDPGGTSTPPSGGTPAPNGGLYYTQFPVHFTEIQFNKLRSASSYVEGDLVLGELSLKYEEAEGSPGYYSSDKFVNLNAVIKELCQLSNGMFFADNAGNILLRNRIPFNDNFISIDEDETVENPEKYNPNINESVTIGDIFLADGHPIKSALEDYYANINDQIDFGRKIIYVGSVPILPNHELRLNGVSVNEKIVSSKPVKNNRFDYKIISVWRFL